MEKFAKLSLVASLAFAGLTSAYADSLAEALAASKLKGEIKSQYFTKKSAAGVEDSIWTNGGNLSVTTGSYYGFDAGVTFQTGRVATVEGSGFNAEMNADGSALSEAYIQYAIDKTSFKAGRQYLSSPLIAVSGSRMFKQSFEAYMLSNTDLPNTTLVAGYVTKYQNRTSSSSGSTTIGDAPFFVDVGSDGAYSLYAKNTSIANLTLQSQYIVLTLDPHDKKALYADATYKIGDIILGAQLYNTDNGSASDNGQLFGIKAEKTFFGVHAKVAYTTTGSDQHQQTVFNGLGSAADAVFTATAVGSTNTYLANTNSYQVAVDYKFDNGFGLEAMYTNWDKGTTSESETDLIASYKINKNLSTQLWYVSYAEDTANDYHTRFYVSYSF